MTKDEFYVLGAHRASLQGHLRPGGMQRSLNQAVSQAQGDHPSPRLNMSSSIGSALGSLQQRQSPKGRRRLWPIMTPLLGLRRPPGRV